MQIACQNLIIKSFKVKNLTVFYRHIFMQILASIPLGLMCLSTAQAAANEDFGRLFSRPAERTKLDSLRQNQALKLVAPVAKEGEEVLEEVPAALPAPITLQGYVKRNDGSKSTLWINNQAVQEDSTVDDVQIGKLNKRSNTSTDGLDLKIPANGKHIRLKAGQMYEPETNQIKELKTVEKEKQLNLQETGEINSNTRYGELE